MIWILGAAAVLGLAWVAYSKSKPAVPNQPGRTIDFHASDNEMNEAKKLARDTLPLFYARFAERAEGEDEFMVKFDADPSPDVEYMWAGLVSRSGTTLFGVLLGDAINTDGKEGDRVVIQEADVIDWAHRKDGVVVGNFTMRVMLKRMSEEEAARHRAFLGW
jgi:uncharacterized protein YegJ (DUF2314 family)